MRNGTKRRPSTTPSPAATKQRRTESRVVGRGEHLESTQPRATYRHAERETERIEPPEMENNSVEREEVHATSLSAGDVNALDLIVNGSEKRIMKHISMLYKKIVLDVKGNESMIQELAKSVATLDSNVSGLRALSVQTSTAIVRNGSTGKPANGKKNFKTTLEKEIERLHPTIVTELPAVFDSVVVSQAAARSVNSYMDSCHQKQDDFRMTGRAIAVFTYGLQSGMRKYEFKQGAGKKHADFRFKIAVGAVRDALLISDLTFKEKEQQVLADIISESQSSSKLAQHFQLQPENLIGYLRE